MSDLLCSCAVASKSKLSFLKLGTDRTLLCFKSDMFYRGSNARVEDVSSVSQCYAKCREWTSCKFWSWKVTGTNRYCQLIESVVDKVENNNYISGKMDGCKWSKLIPYFLISTWIFDRPSASRSRRRNFR